MIEIILVRHGETDWNASETFRGRVEVALNDVGLRQADDLGGYLANEKIDIIYSGPLRRAVDTAKSIADYQNLEVNTVKNLTDIDFGDWQGVSWKEVEEKYPELYRDWLDTPEQVKIPGGESLEDVRRRAVPFVEDAVMRCGEGKIVFVSHHVVIKVVICALLGLDISHFWNFRIDTSGISRFAVGDGRLELTAHNDTSFLTKSGEIAGKDF
ncbi:MAG: histidine phosphatase family protein [Dehalococcoidia bacterium]|jgi:broad specificity phosphatase PhoE